MRLRLADGQVVRVATLIPSCKRSVPFMAMLQTQPWVAEDPDLFVGIEFAEQEFYEPILRRYPNIRPVYYMNPIQSAAIPREHLRHRAVKEGYHAYLSTDDNAFYTEESRDMLARAVLEHPHQPAIISGYHDFMAFRSGGAVPNGVMQVNGIRTYAGVSFPQVCIPHAVYNRFSYPTDIKCAEDLWFAMWCLREGYTEWRICIDAPFAKRRQEAGGYGNSAERHRKSAMGMGRIMLDFPEMAGHIRTTIPWSLILTQMTKEKEQNG